MVIQPASLVGKRNPHIGGGAISNLRDYGKLLRMQLNDGWCGPHRVLPEGATEFMRIERKLPVLPPEPDSGQGYGLGWWIRPQDEFPEPNIYFDPGGFGAHAWIDTQRGYGAIFLVENLSQTAGGIPG